MTDGGGGGGGSLYLPHVFSCLGVPYLALLGIPSDWHRVVGRIKSLALLQVMLSASGISGCVPDPDILAATAPEYLLIAGTGLPKTFRDCWTGRISVAVIKSLQQIAMWHQSEWLHQRPWHPAGCALCLSYLRLFA